MAYNTARMKDWQIAEAAEVNMPEPDEWREKLGLGKEEVIPYGRVCKLDAVKIMERLKGRQEKHPPSSPMRK